MGAIREKKIYLHLGAYKTATTFLQGVLWQNFSDPDGDIYYPRVSLHGKAHHYLATEEFPRWTNGVPRAEYERSWQRLLEEIGRSNAGSVVISSEMFCSLDPEQICYIRGILCDYPVRAIIYLRRQDQYISSLAAQLIKGCNYKPEYYTDMNRAISFFGSSEQFDYENMCAHWAGAIGAENLMVRPFEQSQFHEGDILKDFFHHLLGRPVPENALLPAGNMNPRLCRDALEFKQLVNRLPIDRETKNATLAGLFAYSGAVDARTQGAWQEHVMLSPSQRLDILRRCADGNARIARAWLGREDGVLFREAMPDSTVAWTPYPGVSRQTLEAIVHFLSERDLVLVASLARAAFRADRTDREVQRLFTVMMNFLFTKYIVDRLKTRVRINRPVVSVIPISFVSPPIARLMGRFLLRKKENPPEITATTGLEKKPVPALFLHIRKTGGTSIVRQAIGHYGYENVCNHGDYMGKSPGDFKHLPFVSGHFGFDYARELMAGRFSFTFLRNPIERILSLYSFCRVQDPEEFPIYRAAATHDLDGFLQAADSDALVRSYIRDSQVWCLASGPGYGECASDALPPEKMFEQALTNTEQLSFIGFTETFDDDARRIMRALNMNLIDTIRKDNVTRDKIAVADLPDRTIRLLEELTQWDQKLYEALWRRRSDRLQAENGIILNRG
jgi:hypothetical protein